MSFCQAIIIMTRRVRKRCLRAKLVVNELPRWHHAENHRPENSVLVKNMRLLFRLLRGNVAGFLLKSPSYKARPIMLNAKLACATTTGTLIGGMIGYVAFSDWHWGNPIQVSARKLTSGGPRVYASVATTYEVRKAFAISNLML
jgi:hypothetical protein